MLRVKVYIVTEFVNYDHDEIAAVFANEAAARTFCDERNEAAARALYEKLGGEGWDYDDWSFEEWEVREV